jgi:transitional endoplasmic reticulum ATPase
VELETPNVSWDEIGGLDALKQTLQESVEGALLYPELYQHTKAKARVAFCFGVPLARQNVTCQSRCSQARANFIAVNGPELLSKWVGASEQAVRELFAKARQAHLALSSLMSLIRWLLHAVVMAIQGVSDRVVGQLLTELDGLHECPHVLLVGATNRPEALDPALLRSGRLDLQLKVDLPDEASRLAILQVHNHDRPLAAVDLAFWATQTDAWNGADLTLLSNQAALEAIRRYRREGLSNPGELQIVTDDFMAAYQRLLEQRHA